jgi:predicted nucleotidyltransferase
MPVFNSNLILKPIKKFVKALFKENIRVDKVILYGSYAVCE